jgi:hypothetical protein
VTIPASGTAVATNTFRHLCLPLATRAHRGIQLFHRPHHRRRLSSSQATSIPMATTRRTNERKHTSKPARFTSSGRKTGHKLVLHHTSNNRHTPNRPCIHSSIIHHTTRSSHNSHRANQAIRTLRISRPCNKRAGRRVRQTKSYSMLSPPYSED